MNTSSPKACTLAAYRWVLCIYTKYTRCVLHIVVGIKSEDAYRQNSCIKTFRLQRKELSGVRPSGLHREGGEDKKAPGAGTHLLYASG